MNKRQAHLAAWMAYHGLTRAEIARRIGISQQMVGQILSGKKIPQHRIDQLVNLGIPAEYLPKKGNGDGHE